MYTSTYTLLAGAVLSGATIVAAVKSDGVMFSAVMCGDFGYCDVGRRDVCCCALGCCDVRGGE